MTRPTVCIHDCESGQVSEREMTDDEYAQHEADKAARGERIAAEQAKADAKAELLARLGITAEEAKLLLS